MLDEWKKIILDGVGEEYIKDLHVKLGREYGAHTVYPPKENVYRALDFFTPENTKVVIIGQDPYIGAGQATGLAFDCSEPYPPSLLNIMKAVRGEYKYDGGVIDLGDWAKQGVLLLNASLTVRAGQSLSHANIGWERVIGSIINYLNEKCANIVWLLWGAYARKCVQKRYERHLYIDNCHPSPLSFHRGFMNICQFADTNKYLIAHGKTPVSWMRK